MATSRLENRMYTKDGMNTDDYFFVFKTKKKKEKTLLCVAGRRI
jgi:hypothetical protein